MIDYNLRRSLLAEQLPPASAMVLPGANVQYRNHDTEWLFRQNSYFYYLTGFNEPDAWLVAHKAATGQVRWVLFNLPKDREQEVWTGIRLGQQQATALGVDSAFPTPELDQKMPELLLNCQHIYYPMGIQPDWDKRILGWRKRCESVAARARRQGETVIHTPQSLHHVLPLIDELRLVKSDAELSLIRKACAISAAAHTQLMQACRPGRSELALEADFLHHCLREGCRSAAYSPIVGGGANACILHYTTNQATLNAGDLVLVDAGGEYQQYASDITRTFPVNGKFSDPQRQLYELVLAAQLAGIAVIAPGVACNQVQTAILDVLVPGLVELGLLQGDPKTLIADKAYRRFYMHGSGHWMGLDVHDPGAYQPAGSWRLFAPGMVLTVEPGLYVAPDDTSVAAKWRGIGIRIEDNVLVTATGVEVLTQDVVKSVVDIEALMAG